jgi:hypothetical protein
MANYFPVSLTYTAWSWLMNLPLGSLFSWEELCRQFTANFESAYSQFVNEADLYVVQQRSGESLQSFIQRFSQVRNTIPHISNASVVVAFQRGVRDHKILEKLATHDVQDISELFNLADKCVRATEGHTCHSQPAEEVGKAGKSDTDVVAQANSKKKKKKVGRKDNLLAGAPTTAAAATGGGHAPRGDKCPRQPSVSDEGGQRCSVHNSKHHSAEECREIKKLAEQLCEQQKLQPRHDGMPPR